MDTWFVLIILTIVGGAFLLIVLRRKRREQRSRSFARSQHLQWSRHDVFNIQQRYRNLDILNQGYNRQVSDLYFGTTAEGLITLFGYRYQLGFGGEQQTFQWRVGIVETARAIAPCVQLPTTVAGISKPPRSQSSLAHHQDERKQQEQLALKAWLDQHPRNYWEIHSRFRVIATPLTGQDTDQFLALLDQLRQFAQRTG